MGKAESISEALQSNGSREEAKQREEDQKKPSLSQRDILERLGVIGKETTTNDATDDCKDDKDVRKRLPSSDVSKENLECSRPGRRETDAKKAMLEALARKRESAVELLVKESLRENSRHSTTSLEEEVEARIMRKLLQERQEYILQEQEGEEEWNETDLEEDSSPPRLPSEHLELPTSIPAQSKLRNAEFVTSQIVQHGAVRVPGMNSSDDDMDEFDEENPAMDQSNMSHMAEMQLPQPSAPDYFHDQITLEATLVSETIHSKGSTGHVSGRLFVEAKPMEDEPPKDLQCRDVIKSKKICCRIATAIALIVGLLLAILLPLARTRFNAPQQSSPPILEPFQSGLDSRTVEAIENPYSAQARANLWILDDPAFDTYTPERQLQRFAMATFYYEADGSNWRRRDSWLEYETNECNWYMAHQGNSCNSNGELEMFNLTSNNLQGSLPVELYYLEAVRFLDFSNNGLVGSAPALSDSALMMEVVDLSNNSLSSYIAAELGFQNTHLRVMKNSYNQFDGSLPGLFGLAPNMEVFESIGNRYQGTIPTIIGRLNLEVLKIGYNKFEGSIPTEIGNMPKLRELDLSGNTLINGTIPSSLGSVTTLESLDFRNTSLTGKVPFELCEMQASGQVLLYVDCNEDLLCCE